jgi:hypothetical protein
LLHRGVQQYTRIFVHIYIPDGKGTKRKPNPQVYSSERCFLSPNICKDEKKSVILQADMRAEGGGILFSAIKVRTREGVMSVNVRF